MIDPNRYKRNPVLAILSFHSEVNIKELGNLIILFINIKNNYIHTSELLQQKKIAEKFA